NPTAATYTLSLHDALPIYTKEEMKMIQETNKIMGDDSIRVTATTVRIPVMGGHSESVNIEFENDFDVQEVREILAQQEGVIVVRSEEHTSELQSRENLVCR